MAAQSLQSSQLGRTILISRTDKIGDVVLTLPLAGFLKEQIPGCQVYFLGQGYTRTVIESCSFVDKFYDWKEIEALEASERVQFFRSLQLDSIVHVFPNQKIARTAFAAGVPLRIGVAGRIYHWLFCNRLAFVSRKRSGLHEAQLNLKILQGFLPSDPVSLPNLQNYYGLQPKAQLPPAVEALLSKECFNLILHPKSAGSAREWPLERYLELARLLPRERFKVFVTGGPAEAAELEKMFGGASEVYLLAGKLSLGELLRLVQSCDGLVAASTGPLHVAAALGKFCLGIYPLKKPMHAARWGPVGKRAKSVQAAVKAARCQQSCGVNNMCACMNMVTVDMVLREVLEWQKF